MKTKILIQISIAVMPNISIDAQIFNEVAIMQEHHQFGNSVSISGNYAIVGANNEDEDETGGNLLNQAGLVYIFERDGYGIWHEIQKLAAPDRAVGDQFGYSVSISGNYAIISAINEDHDAAGVNEVPNAGAVYIYENNNGTWHFVQKLVAPVRATEDYFGESLDISEKYAIVGAWGEDDNTQLASPLINSGAVYIYNRNEIGIWDLTQKLVDPHRGSHTWFGRHVSIDKNRALIGAPGNAYDDTNDNPVYLAGAAYLFDLTQEGIWNLTQKLVASDRKSNNQFGLSADISGEYAVVGSPIIRSDDEEPNGCTGAAYIFELNNTAKWSQVKKLMPSDNSLRLHFGNSLAISKNIIIVGTDDFYGEDSIPGAGKAYIFARNNGMWESTQVIRASTRSINAIFGKSVAISGDEAIVGASGVSSAYFFEKQTCVPTNTSDPDNIIENGDFGSCDFFPWTLYIHDYLGVKASVKISNGKLNISGITLASEPESWHLQPTQELTVAQLNRLEFNTTYTVSFDAYAETNDRQCVVVVGQNETPYTTVLAENVMLSKENQTYFFDFVLGQKFNKMKFSFDIGQESSAITFDNVRLVKESDHVSVSSSDPRESTRAYPNPVEDELHIDDAYGSDVRLINMCGIVVQTIEVNEKHVILNIHDLPTGIYQVQISKDGFVSQHKIIVQ